MANDRRQKRVSEFIREEVAVLMRDLHDPRLGFITVISVDVSPDLTLAKVYYTVLGSDVDKRNTKRALDHAASFFRKKIGEALQIRSAPSIEFIHNDDSKKENPAVLDLIERARASDPD